MPAEIWEKVLLTLKPNINNQSFNWWLKDTQAIGINDSTLKIKVTDDTAKEHIAKTYTREIEGAIELVTGKKYVLEFIPNNIFNSSETAREIDKTVSYSNNKGATIMNDNRNSIFSPDFTFENFIIGPNNDLAFATSQAVALNPTQTRRNPLFIYGSSGLGKTHLLKAIGHEINKTRPYLNVCFVSTDMFISEFIASIQNGTQESFKIKYRNVDVLLIDDIQFLEKKEGTQDEFFHTFNALHEHNKQIVISCDRLPQEIPSLADRLKTRFVWGVITDIKPPDLETREAIIRNKAEKVNLDMTDEAYSFIASRIKSSIRSLESAVNRLQQVAEMQRDPITITVDHAKIHLKTLFDTNINKKITIYDIMQKVAEKFEITPDDIKSSSRQAKITTPRFLVMYLARNLIRDMTMEEIGREIGNRDHSTVVNGVNKIAEMKDTNIEIKDFINDITEELKTDNS